MMDHKGNEHIKEELGIKKTRKGNNEKYHMEELELWKRIPCSCLIDVNRKAEEVTEVSSLRYLHKVL
jgi:hypothetical protein